MCAMKAFDTHYEQPTPRRPFAAPTPSTPQERPNTPNSPDGELRELLASNKYTAFVDDPHKRPLSSLSTEAGPSPSPTPEDVPPRPASCESANSPSQRFDSLCPPQARKIFIGGVPQDLTNTDLYSIFAVYGGVKKAWLQKCRTNNAHSGQGPQNHRGFGFAIFHDAGVVDYILGPHFSRFITLWDGRKLEVKRAVSSNNIGEGVRSTGSARGGNTATPMASAATAPTPITSSAQQVGYTKRESQPPPEHVFEEPLSSNHCPNREGTFQDVAYSGTSTIGSLPLPQFTEAPFLHQPQPQQPTMLNPQAVPFRASMAYPGPNLSAMLTQLHQHQHTPPPQQVQQQHLIQQPLHFAPVQRHLAQQEQQQQPGTPTQLPGTPTQHLPGTPTQRLSGAPIHVQQQPQGPVDLHQVLQQFTGLQTQTVQVSDQANMHQPRLQHPQPLAPQELAAMLLRAQPECYDD